MWVFKLGGDLALDALLPQWLDMLAQLGGGRATVVCGGGGFADEVRRAQTRWQLDGPATAGMAALAMAQSACLAHGLQPALRLATDHADLLRVLHSGHAALWLPLDRLRAPPGAGDANADADDDSADGLALALALALNAERLVLVKSQPMPTGLTLAGAAQAGLLGRRFAERARRAAFPVELVHKNDLAAVRTMLLGGARGAGA